MVNARPIVAAVASVLGFAEQRVYGSSAFYYQNGALALTEAMVEAGRRGLKGMFAEELLRPRDAALVVMVP